METTNGGSESPSAVAQLKRQVQNLEAELRRLDAQLAKVKQTNVQLDERLRVHAAELRKGSDAQAQMRTLATQLERQAAIIKHDNAVARRLQEGLRPLWEADFEGIRFAVRTAPGERVSGDFYDIIKISESCVALLAAGVSGYGLTAAVLMAQARLAFRTFATMESSPLAMMENVNERLLETTLADHHVTAFMGLLDTDMLTFQYMNASHCPAFLIREGEVTPLDTEGLFVGILPEPRYEQKSIELQMQDKLFLFNDGVVKLFGDGGWECSIGKLQDYLRQNADLPIQRLIVRLSEDKIHEPADDVTILGVELLRSRTRSKEISIYSVPVEVRRVEDTILPILSARGYGERALFAVRLAMEEAIINAIQHGNKLDSTKKVKIGLTLDDDKAIVSVTDEGEGFDLNSVVNPTLDENLEATSGRGIALMKAYMDSIDYNETGNQVTMTKLAPWVSREA